tara:strand:+ start:6249 stop:8762 length:2514 start_codon:yes stop_codon:yes gene_type:complete
MSRLDTQQDRLTRGPDTGSARTFIAQPARFQADTRNRADQLIKAVGAAGGTVVGAVEQQNRVEQEQEAKLRAKEFNSAVSDLTRLESEWKSDPDNDGKDYLKALTSYENVFDESTDEGVKIRRQFSTGPEVVAAERKQVDDADKARQGGYVMTAKALTDNYRSEDSIESLSNLDFPERKAVIERQILETYPPKVREKLSDQSLFAISEEASKAAAFSNPLFKEKQDFFQETVNESRYTELLSSTVDSGNISVEDVNQHARDTRTLPDDIYNRLADDHIARLELSMSSGRAEDTLNQMSLLSDMVGKLDGEPQLQAEIQDKIVGATARFAANDSIQVQQIADASVMNRLTSDQTETVLNSEGIKLYEQSMGVNVADDITRVEDIPVENDLQQTYRDTVAGSVDEGMTRHDEASSDVTTALSVAANPDQSSRSDVQTSLTLDGPDRVAYLDTFIESMPDPDPNDPEDILLDDTMRRLAKQAKTDNAAYAALQSSQLTESIHYGEGLRQFVTPNLEESTLSQEGLRQAIAYTEADLPTVARVAGEGRDVYALANTIREAELNPNIDLPTVYRNYLNDYDSVRWDVKGAGDEGVNLDQLMTTPKFRKDLLGTETAAISPTQRKTILTLLDVRSVDPKGSSGAVVPQFKEQLASKGYAIIAEESASGSVVTSIVNYTNIPEAVPSLDKESVTLGLNSDQSGFSRYTGQLLEPGENRDLHDIALDKLRTNPNLLRDQRFGEVLDRDELFKLIESGQGSFFVASRQADTRGAPITFRFVSGDGAIVNETEIGRVHFNDPGYANRGKGFFETPKSSRKTSQPARQPTSFRSSGKPGLIQKLLGTD